MMRALLQIVLNGVAVLIAAYLIQGIEYTGSLPYLLLVGLVIGVLNLLVKPIVTFFSFPLIVVTLGLFYLVINGLMLWLA
ncbi:MAG TPA: phage holin family protein, partial [Thermoanaerobaculia bacterium]|nr:phage holin family protein [Thermoanaerobaculia bacterium]